MNIFSKITLKSLRKNKTRTAVTIIGIILSTALVCAVTTSVSSLKDFGLENMIYECGDWHGVALETDISTVDMVSSSQEVEKVTVDNILGYAQLEEYRNESKPYLYIIGADNAFFEMMPVHMSSGRIPQSIDEIILPDHLRTDGGINYELGDIITLNIGDRMSDNFLLGQNNPYNAYNSTGEKLEADEEFNPRETRSYTVVGFYERPDFESYSAPGYTAITVMDLEATGWFDIYFKMEDPKTVYSFMSENNLGSETNTNVLMFSGAARYDTFYQVLYSLAAIFTLLIVFGSVSLIYNAFSISVSERTKQFGLLSSIGATRKQLRRSVQFEALAVSTIGIPLGILVGIAGIGITLYLIGDSFAALGSFKIPMSLSVSPMAVVIAVIISLITVFISVLIPARRATKITAIDAIRQSMDVSNGTKRMKTSHITYKIFGLPGVLASKYYKRSRKKYRATVVSLFMSIVLFVSASAFTGYLNDSAEIGFDTKGYDLNYYQTPEEQELVEPERLMTLLSEDEYVTDSAMTVEKECMALLGREYMTKQAQEYMDSGYWNGSDGVGTTVCFVDDEFYRVFLEEQGLDPDQYMNSQEPLAYAFDGRSIFDSNSERFVQVKLLDSDNAEFEIKKYKEIKGYYLSSTRENADGSLTYIYQPESNEQEVLEVPENEAVEQTHVSVGHVSYDEPFFVDSSSMLTLLFPISAMQNFIDQDETYVVNFLFKSENHTQSYNNMYEMLLENNLSAYRLQDYAKNAEQYRNIILIVNVFSYGFIVLISLIAAANVFNTITTNINLRKRDFAMLKSVGMEQKGFNKMMNYECLLYGSRALLYGLPVSILISWFIFKSVSYGLDISFQLPWVAIGIAVLSVFVVVFITMMYSIRKLKKDNPIDAMKNENL